LHFDASELRIVVSAIGEQWSTNKELARQI